jgi:predicted restriction endonuclease
MFRAVVLKTAGWQCQWIGEDGERCEQRTNLQAHHMAPFRDTGSMHGEHGVALCRPHHEQAERAIEQATRPPAAA